jgi:hypothetical protein
MLNLQYFRKPFLLSSSMKLVTLYITLHLSIFCLAQDENQPVDSKKNFEELDEKLRSAPPSADKLGEAKPFNAYDENYERFKNSPCFRELGFIPGRDNETIYRECEEGKQKEKESDTAEVVSISVILVLSIGAAVSYFATLYKKKSHNDVEYKGSSINAQQTLITTVSTDEILESMFTEAEKHRVNGDIKEELVCNEKIINTKSLPIQVYIEAYLRRASIFYYENKLGPFRTAAVKAFELLPDKKLEGFKHYEEMRSIFNSLVKDVKNNNSESQYSDLLMRTYTHLNNANAFVL